MTTAICDAAIHLCAIRATRLDSLGNPSGGPNNVYVSGNPIMITVTPQIEAGQDKVLVGGCDCVIANYRGTDKLKRFDLEMDFGVLEPGLIELLLGAPAILDSGGQPIGWHWPNQLNCVQPQQPNVCLEGWQTLWDDDHPAAGTYQYVHFIWPSTHWSIGAHTLQNDFNQPKITGYTRGNPNWGLGIYGDLPEAAQPLGSVFYASSIPTAACGYQTHNLS